MRTHCAIHSRQFIAATLKVAWSQLRSGQLSRVNKDIRSLNYCCALASGAWILGGCWPARAPKTPLPSHLFNPFLPLIYIHPKGHDSYSKSYPIPEQQPRDLPRANTRYSTLRLGMNGNFSFLGLFYDRNHQPQHKLLETSFKGGHEDEDVGFKASMVDQHREIVSISSDTQDISSRGHLPVMEESLGSPQYLQSVTGRISICVFRTFFNISFFQT